MSHITQEPSKELLAVGAFLSAMHDQDLNGAKVREAMLEAMGIDSAALAQPAEQFRDRVCAHLANRYAYSHGEFCTKLEELLAETQPAEPTVKNSLTVAEQSAELDAGMAAQHYCRGLWGAARGHSEWRKVHEHFASGYKQGRYDELMAQGPDPYPDGKPAEPVEPAEPPDRKVGCVQHDCAECVLRASQPAAAVDKDSATWCAYVAGIICCYLGESVEGDKCKAIAGIIERRFWALPVPAAPVELSNDLLTALVNLHKVVIAHNCSGADWGVLFGQMMTALSHADEAMTAAKRGAV